MQVHQDASTRHMVLTRLKTSGPLTVGELAAHLGITEMAVRRHLNTLERDGLIDSTLVRQPMGRPSYTYAVTEHAEFMFPNNYHGLTLDLLEELEAVSEQEDLVGRLFDRRKEKLVRRYRDRIGSSDIEGRVEALANIQNENGYMATWSRDHEAGYIIDEFNCPIAQVANRYQHACQSELELFEELLGVQVERVECLAKDGKRCRYVIRSN